MYDISIKVKNYKCFKEPAGFDRISRVNLIIGKNNSGKSSLLDVIEQVTSRQYHFERVDWNSDLETMVFFKARTSKEDVNRVFPNGGTIQLPVRGRMVGYSVNSYKRQFIDKEIVFKKIRRGSTVSVVFETFDDDGISPRLTKNSGYPKSLAQKFLIPIEGRLFRKVAAERDLKLEIDKRTSGIEPNGDGITSTIRHFLQATNLPREKVKKDMLQALNKIFNPDGNFLDIDCQRNTSDLWEIYLEDERGKFVALSKSGSGLKTVIVVLTNLFLAPVLDQKKSLKDYIFAFEELENNIHPALLRRLVNYIDKKSIEDNFPYFLTTHSSVLIDQFSKQEDAQIIHVTQENGVSQCHTVQTYVENKEILSDLDVRASDLLQSNGIIWVEGPSDRIYLNKWIELWSEEELEEGLHYQIMFYGGSNIAHLSAGGEDSVEDDILILKMNHNAIILMDSDKRGPRKQLKPAVRRIKNEFNNLGALCWVTKGKEVENYISEKVVDSFLSKQSTALVGQYDSFFAHLIMLKPKGNKTWENRKAVLARRLTPLMTLENMKHVLDLDSQMIKVCKQIRFWNGLQPKT